MGLINLGKKAKEKIFGSKDDKTLDQAFAYRPGYTPEKTFTQKIGERFAGVKSVVKSLDPKGIKIALLVAGVLLLLIAQPAITGYVVKNRNAINNLEQENFKLNNDLDLMKNMTENYESQVVDLEKDLAVLDVQVDGCTKTNNDLTVSVGQYKSDMESCKSEMNNKIIELNGQIDAKQVEINDRDKQITDLEQDIIELKTQMDQKDLDYNSLGKNAANTVCCTQRIYNSMINSYEIKNNQIYCVTGSAQKITCN